MNVIMSIVGISAVALTASLVMTVGWLWIFNVQSTEYDMLSIIDVCAVVGLCLIVISVFWIWLLNITIANPYVLFL